MYPRQKFISVSLIFFLAAELLPNGARAVEFNPDFILADDELQNPASMNRADIQAFLEGHGSALARLSLPDASSALRNASDIVYRASQTHRINPKYLLVKLQKEQSLVTERNPSQKQLDWATGYGVCDDCRLDDPDIQKHKGFGVQADSAAAVMRWYFDNLDSSPWIKRPGVAYAVDNATVRPANLATAFLYTYTPHLEGNRNFWALWQRWFSQVYPDGSLLKTAGDPTVYVIEGGKKRAFASMSALVTRFDPKLIITAPESELARYDSGAPVKLANYAVLRRGDAHYLLDTDTIRPFESAEVVRRLGYHPDEIIDIEDSDILGYKRGEVITVSGVSAEPPLGRVVRVKETGARYYLKDKVAWPILDPAIAAVNFPNLATAELSVSELNIESLGEPIRFKDGTLFGVVGSADVYVAEKGRKRRIPSDDVFAGLGYRRSNVIRVNEFAVLAHGNGEPLFLRPSTPEAEEQNGEATEQELEVMNVKMFATPSGKQKTSGPTFDTPINTYAIADEGGRVLSAKNADETRPMASFAKVATAYQLVAEGLKTWGATAYNPKEHKTMYTPYRVAPGEVVRNSDLFTAMLVSSLNAPARMLVDSLEKDEKKFIARLNSAAKQLNLKRTFFADITGESLDSKTTAREFLTFWLKATNNVDVRQALGAASYEYDEIKDLDGKPRHFDRHSNLLVHKNDLPFFITASKTAYLDEAGAGLAMTIRRNSDGKIFHIITMGNPHTKNKFAEPERLARWAVQTFDN